MKTNLLLIDCQNDFMEPTGALYVPGAEKDAERISALIQNNALNIDNIYATLDQHHYLDIAHPSFWKDKNGAFAIYVLYPLGME